MSIFFSLVEKTTKKDIFLSSFYNCLFGKSRLKNIFPYCRKNSTKEIKPLIREQYAASLLDLSEWTTKRQWMTRKLIITVTIVYAIWKTEFWTMGANYSCLSFFSNFWLKLRLSNVGNGLNVSGRPPNEWLHMQHHLAFSFGNTASDFRPLMAPNCSICMYRFFAFLFQT